MNNQQSDIRQRLLLLRQKMSPKQLVTASDNLGLLGSTLPELAHAKTIASYIAHNGEISAEPLLSERLHTYSASKKTKICLPRITNFQNKIMLFFHNDGTLLKNRYGILEPPLCNKPVDLKQTDIVFIPLVAFNRLGQRIGMGGGYYDRALQSIHHLNKPLLIGLAHHFQEVDKIPKQDWDINLNIILTDKAIIRV